MMNSLVINSIRSAVNALERSDDIPHYEVIKRKYMLKNLELFVLCARKFGNDAQLRFYDGKVSTLGSLLQRIRDVLLHKRDMEILKNFPGAIATFNKEIGVWYNTLLASLPQPTFDDITDIIDSLLDILNGICLVSSYNHRHPKQPIEALIEKITFLRNFIRFATLRSVEPRHFLNDLLVHVQAVAVDAAHTSYIYVLGSVVEPSPSTLRASTQVRPNFPTLLQMFKMVDPQVDETYTQALTSTKLSTELYPPIPDKDSVIMKDFIDSLLWNLWEKLHTDTPIVISTTSELQLVYEGLRLLRSMLKEQPNKFHKQIGELTRVVICDAGIIIFSLYQRDKGIVVPTSGLLQKINRFMQIVKGKDFSIPDLLQRISHIRQRVEGRDLSIPDLQQRILRAREQVGENDLPKTNELGFIDFVLENLLGTRSSKAGYGLQSQFRMIRDELSSLRYSLGKIEGLRNEQKGLEDLWNAGIKVAYRVEFLIDQLLIENFQDSSSTSFDSIVEDVLEEIKSVNSKTHTAPDIQVKNISTAPSIVPSHNRAPVVSDGIVDFDDDIADIEVKKMSIAPNLEPSQNRAPVADELVGFDDDIASIINRLTRGSKQLKMVAIVGMPGRGKTALATKVFNHPSVTFHFHVRLWCCVSQLFGKKNLLLELLNLDDSNANIKMSEQDLTEKLWRHLKRKRYLIFLDDVWDIEAWDSLKTSFPDDSYESRILVTSRHHDAIPQAMLDGKPHSPRQLSEDQSWELLRKKLTPRNEWSLALDELGKQIAANCKGLPLTVVVVAGLLANTEPQHWKIFLESISSISSANHCRSTLELSYKHLPGHLKECFLYFGLFPEDREVPVRRLIQLWIAEGIVFKTASTESKSLEDVARDYMMDLVGRSLVIVSKKRSRGGVKACRIHDLLHDFCRTKAKEEKFFHLLKGYDELLSFEEPDYMRRLCVHSEKKHFKNLRLFCPRLHSLLFFTHGHGWDQHDISFIIPRYSRLRVLDIGQYDLSLWNGIPTEIELFLQLKYLSVSSGDNPNIPSSIGSLANLETFILYSPFGVVSLPDTFWNLKKLRHVDIVGGFRLAFENLENFPNLYELQSCSKIIIGHGESIEQLVRKFPNIRKLRFSLDSNEIKVLIPDSLSQLESFRLSRFSQLKLQLNLPENLRKLSLFNFSLHQSDDSRIGKLPNLEVLKFQWVEFHENTWDMVEGEFSTLRFLKLNNSGIVRWRGSDDQFPYLQKLVLEDCCALQEIPCCFESIDTLEMVLVKDCCDYVNSFFHRIEAEQTEMGNSFPKIQISGHEGIFKDE